MSGCVWEEVCVRGCGGVRRRGESARGMGQRTKLVLRPCLGPWQMRISSERASLWRRARLSGLALELARCEKEKRGRRRTTYDRVSNRHPQQR